MIRRTGLLDRKTQHRDARLFLVASEDRYAVQQYFDAAEANGFVDARRVRVVVLPTGPKGRSDPRSVRDRLAELEQALDFLSPLDERWLCLDVDHWATGTHTPNLARVCKEALEAGYQLAISNPAFEQWLLLHLVDEPRPTQSECEVQLRELLGAYNKRRLAVHPWTISRIEDAIERARTLDTDPSQRWPQEPGSTMYRLVERIPRRSGST